MRFLSVVKPAFVVLTAIVAMTVVTMQSARAASVTYNFDRITSNASVDIGSQLSMVVDQNSAGNASFTFFNAVGVASSITDIYFDVGGTSLFSGISLGSSSVGVAFASSANPENLPGGTVINFTADYSGDSNSNPGGVSGNGVNQVGEWVSFLGTWASQPSFDGLIAAISNGNFRVGLHVQSIGADSDSYVNELSPVPLPAAAWLFGSALIGFMFVSNRRRV